MDENSANNLLPTEEKKTRRRIRPVILLLDLLIVAMVVVGLYLILEPIYRHWQQDRLTGALLEQLSSGEGTIVVDPNAFEVPGEEPEIYETTTTTNASSNDPVQSETSAAETTAAAEPETVVITAIGRIQIPDINVDMPIAEGATKYNLRYAIGHYIYSADPGQPGLSVYLGHRMYNYGRHFNRLGEVEVGDKIIIDADGMRYTYEVDQIDTVLPEAVIPEIDTSVEGSRIMLVTCTPIKVASHRLLVKGVLVSSEQIGS